jgi:hypothetical protein
MTRMILAAAVSAIALSVCSGISLAEERRNARMIPSAGESKSYRAKHYRKRRPLQVTIYGRRRGGYSYSTSDVTSSYRAWSPPPYEHVRQTPSGPFDSGFFFDSGIGPRGGDAPYPH